MGRRFQRMAVQVALALSSEYALAQQDSGNLKYERRTTFSPNDYLLKSRDEQRDAVFDKYPTVDLGVDLAIGSDCGRVDFKSTMRSSLSNMLDSKYFGDLGKDIIAASPMLALCYFSPTWCAIVKHSQLSANFLSQMRLDQCALIDKYTDKRTDDFYAERQECVHKKIEENGGDLEAAMDSCKSVWDTDLTSWSGGSNKTESNKLLDSSAAWAGYSGEPANRSLDLLKAFVGDTVVSKGKVSVEYGSRAAPLTPQKHLQALQSDFNSKLCQNLVVRVAANRGTEPLTSTITDRDLKEVSGGAEEILVDRQTVDALAYMPALKREAACRKLADAMAMTTLTKDMSRSLDILTVTAQNPHLPPNRKAELEEKRRSFKESVEMTMELQRQRNAPLNQVVSQINSDGIQYRGEASDRVLSSGAAALDERSARAALFDCADGLMCKER